jgi:hypothetical protein
LQQPAPIFWQDLMIATPTGATTRANRPGHGEGRTKSWFTKGVKQAPQAIPSWHDIAPQSEFIQRIFADPLYPKVAQFLLLFSFYTT